MTDSRRKALGQDAARRIGDRLRELREGREQSQESLALDAGVSTSLVSKAEAGGTASLECYAALANALGVEVMYFDDPKSDAVDQEDGTDRRDAIRTIGATVAALGAMPLPPRQSDLRIDLLEHGWLHPSEYAGVLTHDIALLNRWYQAAQYDAVQSSLPRITGAFSLADEVPACAQLTEAHCDAMLISAKVANKTGDAVEALSKSEMARALAQEAGCTHRVAAANYQKACALLGGGEVGDAEELAMASAGVIEDSSAGSLTWRGALTLLGSILAAKRHDVRCMAERLDEAEDLAGKLGRDGNIGWTAFGPTNVKIHRVSAAVEVDSPKQAADAVSLVDVDAIPAPLTGRRVQVHMDSAWAFFKQRDDARAVLHLLEAERSGPEVIKHSAAASTLVGQLMDREKRGRTPGLRLLAQRLGVVG